jgi:hypothetical protein
MESTVSLLNAQAQYFSLFHCIVFYSIHCSQPSGEHKYEQEEPLDMGMFHPPRQPNWRKRSSKTAVETSPSSSIDTPTKAPPESPPMKPRNITNLEREEEEESWYKQQSCCFPDVFDLLRVLPRRYK